MLRLLFRDFKIFGASSILSKLSFVYSLKMRLFFFSGYNSFELFSGDNSQY